MAGYICMAGEAARQIMGGTGGYSVRHVVVKSALVVPDAVGTEIITAFRRHKLTDSNESEWFDFSITSYSGSIWITHCEGQVTTISTIPGTSQPPKNLPRQVSTARFYERLSEVGINFGPWFRRLRNASSSVTEDCSTAEVEGPNQGQHDTSYALHPVVIDASFQLAIMAGVRGLGRKLTKLRLPTLLDRVDVLPGSDIIQAVSRAPRGDGSEVVECSSDGLLVLKVSGLHTSIVDDGGDVDDSDPHAAARLEWVPDFDFVDPAPLLKPADFNTDEIRLIEEMAYLCVLNTLERIEGLEPSQPHFHIYRRWLKREVNLSENGGNALVPNAAAFSKMSTDERCRRINDLYELLLKMGKKSLSLGLKRIFDNFDQIFTGKAEPIDLLTQDGLLTELYNAVSFGYGNFVRILSHSRPTLRILEVGAGTGGTTDLLLRELVHNGLPRYLNYTFTDISAGFFSQAKERFSYAPNMEYKVLDITKDPLGQDFQPSSYDLIIAANVVHATPSIKESLSNLNKLLKPRGMLLLTELCSELRVAGYIFGTFSGWWLGQNDGREFSPYVEVTRWDQELKGTGYTGAETVVYDGSPPFTCCNTILSRKVWDEPKPNHKVSLLSSTPSTGVAQVIRNALEERGIEVTDITIGGEVPENQEIISCLDLEGNFFKDITSEDFAGFQALISHFKSRRTLWLTNPVQIKCNDPWSAPCLGVTRSLRSELELPIFTLEIDAEEENFSALVLQVFDKIRREDPPENLETDKEFAVCNGTVCIGRYQPFSVVDEMAEKSVQTVKSTVALDIGKRGLFETLQWRRREAIDTVPDDSVEIECRAVGLNFRDVLMAMGVIPKTSSHSELGIDVSGVIVQAGPKVKGLRVGDRIFCIAPEGSLATRIVLPSALVKRIPDTLSFEEAASIPVVFTTALQGLINIGRLEKGQSVLIHSACGGVGLAAIQVAQMVGAEIFATVGDEEKVTYLTRVFGIPRNRIFSSRDESFYEGIMRETNDSGVDVVLNSLSGSLLHTSWKCVAPFGMLVEIGKRDLLEHGKLDMNPFLANRTYFCYDGIEVSRKRPETMGR